MGRTMGYTSPLLTVEDTSTTQPEPLLGQILLADGMIQPGDENRILYYQRTYAVSFGEAAIKLRLINREQLQQALAVQFGFPHVGDAGASLHRDLIIAHDPFHPQAERMRAVRTHLLMHWFDDCHHKLAVVSPNQDDGRSYVSANLAVAFAQIEGSTLLIDADLRTPTLHTFFGLSNTSGLSTLLAGRSVARCFQYVSPFPNLSVLVAGPPPPNPQELLSGTSFPTLLCDLEHAFDRVIIDTPAAATGADAGIIAASAGGTLLVACRHQTRVLDLARLKQQIQDTGATIVGGLLNR